MWAPGKGTATFTAMLSERSPWRGDEVRQPDRDTTEGRHEVNPWGGSKPSTGGAEWKSRGWRGASGVVPRPATSTSHGNWLEKNSLGSHARIRDTPECSPAAWLTSPPGDSEARSSARATRLGDSERRLDLEEGLGPRILPKWTVRSWRQTSSSIRAIHHCVPSTYRIACYRVNAQCLCSEQAINVSINIEPLFRMVWYRYWTKTDKINCGLGSTHGKRITKNKWDR